MTDAIPAPLQPPSDRSAPDQPAPDGRRASGMALLRSIDARVKPDLKRAVPAVLLAVVSFAAGERLGGTGRSTPGEFDFFGRVVRVATGYVTMIVIGLTLLFLLAGMVATRSIGRELARVSGLKAGVAAASAIRLLVLIVGYLTVGLGVLALLQVNLGNLLVGGAVTGVVVGIAAQQTLGNFFAGLVLLFARPYVPGERVKIRTGAMGGPFVGVIVGAGLMYTTIETEEGLISMPNSGLLGAAIGPSPVSDEPEDPAPGAELGGLPATGGATGRTPVN